MFTGIIEDVGRIVSLQGVGGGARAGIATRLADALSSGDSVAIDGCCLTVAARGPTGFEADLSPETLSRTTFRFLSAGARVNIERPMGAEARFGGHLVQGHVDGVGVLTRIVSQGETREVTIGCPQALLPFLAEKGSIAVNGTSLTVNRVLADGFTVALIPFTLTHTTFGELPEGARVNLEADVIAKYVARAAEAYLQKERTRV